MLKIYNTLGHKLEEFKPIEPGKVKMYYCGPTVYWTQHIGNLRGSTCADSVFRVLKYLGYEVKYVRNYTDVGHLVSDGDEGEDKMEKGAKREGLSPKEIAQKYIDIYEQDTERLNILDPTIKALATEHVEEMKKMVETLLEKGFVYTTDLAVYFDVSKFKDYTKLSGQDLEKQQKGAGTGDVEDPQKKHPTDFALWFFKAGNHSNAIQTWPSNFQSSLVENGQGFPGWHIECSAMSKKHLGDTIDIHMGGVEHIPIHHTNEIAQSESANGVKFANYWLHNEHLLVDSKKMSKSEGTSYVLQDIIDKGYNPLALRYFFLQANYRSKQNFTWEALTAAQNGLEHLYNQIKELGQEKGSVNQEFKDKFVEKVGDDFNTPQALAVVQELLKSDLTNQDKLSTILDFDQVLGLNFDQIKEVGVPDEVKNLAEQRLKAKQKKDFEVADKIRNQIKEKGFVVEDTKDGYDIKEL